VCARAGGVSVPENGTGGGRDVVMCVRGEGNRVGDVHACKGNGMEWDG
jgi:hypothetical protein